MSEGTAARLPAGDVLRCVDCGGALAGDGNGVLRCESCGTVFPIENGTIRMLPPALREAPIGADSDAQVKRQTAESFAYEWGAFGRPRAEWQRNFDDYMRPLRPAYFDGKDVLDVGTGSGRHAAHAARLGARVVAVDIGSSIDVARRNLPQEVATIQADAEALPLAEASFDLVMSIGVLHHLPDTERALRALVPLVRPGGHVHIYLYWEPERPSHRLLLRGVSLVRRVTTRMSHRLLHALCYPLAAVLFVGVVSPYRVMRRVPLLDRVARVLPLKAYADYPFGVLVNDQFDRFSAPIERRFTRADARKLMTDAGLIDVSVLPNNGWVCDGRKPPVPSTPDVRATGAAQAEQVIVRAVGAQSPTSPGFRIRVLLLQEALAHHGVEVDPQLLFSEGAEQRFRRGSPSVRASVTHAARKDLRERLERDAGADVTLIQRQADMWPTLSLERAATGDRPLIWDVDDAIWHDTSREARQHPLALFKGTRRKVDWLADRADHVIAGNRILADWLSDHCDRITVVPSLVETRGMAVREHSDEDEITLGWIGSAATARYLAPLREVLERMRMTVAGRRIRLLVIGGSIQPIEGIAVDQRAWSPAEERVALGEMDIGLMPLPDAPWTRGKCSYKALQYMAAGVPAVASDVGIAAEVIEGGGRVVDDVSEWVEALTVLSGDAGLRQRLGAKARARVESDYSVQRWAPTVARVVRGTL